jgi:hypothetical protein
MLLPATSSAERSRRFLATSVDAYFGVVDIAEAMRGEAVGGDAAAITVVAEEHHHGGAVWTVHGASNEIWISRKHRRLETSILAA